MKVAIVYDAAPEGQVLYYQRWQVKNKATMTISQIVQSEIHTSGGKCSKIYC
jgi:hypothetical protein